MLKRSLPWEMDYALVGTFPFLLKSTQESAKKKLLIVRFPKRLRERGIICTWSSEGYLLNDNDNDDDTGHDGDDSDYHYSKSICTWSSAGHLLKPDHALGLPPHEQGDVQAEGGDQPDVEEDDY